MVICTTSSRAGRLKMQTSSRLGQEKLQQPCERNLKEVLLGSYGGLGLGLGLVEDKPVCGEQNIYKPVVCDTAPRKQVGRLMFYLAFIRVVLSQF